MKKHESRKGDANTKMDARATMGGRLITPPVRNVSTYAMQWQCNAMLTTA